MKYVKLFESWLNTVNEAIDYDKLSEFGLQYVEEMGKNPDKIAKMIVNGVKKMLDTAQEDYRIKISSSVQTKKITILANLKGNEPSKFVFDLSNTSLAGESGKPESLLGYTGSAEVYDFNKSTSANPTTLAQFIYSVITGKEVEKFNDQNPKNYVNAVENLIYVSGGNKFKDVSSKVGKQNISKITQEEFYGLPSEKRTEILNTVLKGKFKVFESPDSEYLYVVAPSKQVADNYKMEFDTDTSSLGDRRSRCAAFTLPRKNEVKDSKSGLADLPIVFGLTDKFMDDTEVISSPVMTKNSVGSKISQNDKIDTTLGALTLFLLDLVDGNMKFGKDRVAQSQREIINAAEKGGYDIASDTYKKSGAEAWKQSTEAVDIAPSKVK